MRQRLKAGADLEAPDKDGWMPLQWAAGWSEPPAVVKALLDAGADLEARALAGQIPVDLIGDDSPLRGTDVYWKLNRARF